MANISNIMSNSTILAPIQQAARLCYRLLSGPLDEADIPGEELTALATVVGSPITPEEMLQITNRSRSQSDFASVQARLLDTWKSRFKSTSTLTDDDAAAFVQELLSALDHAAVYDYGITANTTLLERGTASSAEMQYPGNMPCWTLHLTLEGTGLLISDDMEARVQRGDMMLFHPQGRYHSGLDPAADRWQHFWALFQPRPHWSEWLEWESLGEDFQILHLPDEQSVKEIKGVFSQLVALKDTQYPLQNDLQHNLLEEILIRAAAHHLAASPRCPDERVLLACDYMQSQMTEKFKIEDVAIACNLSPSRLAHLFKKHMGLSPKSWSNNLRLQKARKLLLTADLSISQIAQDVGYEDAAYFTRYFTKSMGCSPSAFRKTFRGSVDT
jgi:AraC family transcriptional regulator, arabinose operon regulatory protein